jgi:hypothetical protein
LALVSGLVLAVPASALGAPVGRSAHAHVAKKKKHKKKKHKPSSGTPTMTVVGFGINHLYVADGTTVSNAADCSTMVQGNGYPYGPPQNIYLNAYIKATGVPGSSEVQIGEDYPGSDDTVRMAVADQDTLSPPIPWSQAFDASTLGFGEPPGSQKDIFRAGLFSEDDQDGPSASDFDGDYSFEVSVVVGGKTLTSTANATVSC